MNDGAPLPTPGQRVSGIDFPQEYRLPPRPPADAPPAVLDAARQTSFVLGGDLRLFAEGMNLQLQLLNDSSHSRYRTHIYAAVVGLWSRAWTSLDAAAASITHGAYTAVPNLVRSACELIAAQHQLHAEETAEVIGWMLAHLKADEEHKAFDAGMGHYFAGSTLAADEGLRLVYRSASDLGRPNFGATLLAVGPESNNQRLAYTFDDRAFHVAWAELTLGWLLRACERQLAVATHMRDVFNVTDESHAAYGAWAARVAATLAHPSRCRMEEIDAGGYKRWLVHNWRRQPSGAPKKVLL